MDTPPPQPAFRLRGSVTDPARLRRRPAFEQVRTPNGSCSSSNRSYIYADGVV